MSLSWKSRGSIALPIDEEVEPGEEEARDELATPAGVEAMRAFLVDQGATALADRLIALAWRDREVSRDLFHWRRLTPPPVALDDLRALVDDIIDPGRNYIAWGTAGPYVARAEAVLPLLASVRARDPDQTVELGEHALRAAWRVLTTQADDSFGEIGGFIGRIAGEWLQALAAAPPRPAAYGVHYLSLLLDDPFGCFDPDAAEAAMGEPARGAFRSELASRWRAARAALAEANRAEVAALEAAARQRLTVRQHAEQVRRADPALRSGVSQLEAHHLRQLEAQRDVEALLDAMQAGLGQPSGYLRITGMLDRMGRPNEALAYARAGCAAFPDQAQLLDDLLQRVERPGGAARSAPEGGGDEGTRADLAQLTAESLEIRRRLFELDPGVDRYRGLLAAHMAMGGDALSLRDDLMRWLQAREQEGVQARPGRGPDVGLRAQILCAEERWEDMFDTLRPPARCSAAVRLGIARSLPPEFAEQCVVLLMGVLEEHLLTAKSPYRSELALVREIAGLLGSMERRRWIHSLRVRYVAKRNFVSGLAGCGE